MSPMNENALSELVVEALERMAFLIVDACDAEDLPGPFDPTRRARIAITGVQDGTVWLDADDGFVCELAAGLLGCDSDEVDPDTTGREALSELANIVGGSVVVALGGQDENYRLGLPELLDEGADATPAGGGDGESEGEGEGDSGAVRTLLASDEGAIAVCWAPADAAAGAGGQERAAA
jgi:hypothetical protein